MGRSVSVPHNATATVYLGIGWEAGDYYDFEDFIEDLQNVVEERYPSFHRTDEWVDREDQAVLENGHAQVVVAEYYGLVSVSLVPTPYVYDGCDELHEAWCNQVAGNFTAHLHKRFPDFAVRRLGTASNGEAFFERV
jgi:hypothetical protein